MDFFFARAPNSECLEHWKAFDISLRLRERWIELGPWLRSRIHVYVARDDTVYLDQSVALLGKELEKLDAGAHVVLREQGGHGDDVWSQIIGDIHESMDRLSNLDRTRAP